LLQLPPTPPRSDWSVEVVLALAPFEKQEALLRGYMDHGRVKLAEEGPDAAFHVMPLYRADASTPYEPGWREVSTRDIPAFKDTYGVPLPEGCDALAMAVIVKNLGGAEVGIDWFTLTDGTCQRLRDEEAAAQAPDATAAP